MSTATKPGISTDVPKTRRTSMMQALTLTAPGSFVYQSVKCPEPAPNEVLVRIEGCGMCASGIPVWEGRDWFQYPFRPGAPGHEGYGIVERTGEQVTKVSPGDRVAMVSGSAFAEFDIAPEDHVVQIPAELNYTPFPGEPFGCAVNILKRSDIAPGQTVAVIGVGFLGALIIQMIAKPDVRVIAISKRRYSLSIAEKYGAVELIGIDENHIEERIHKLTDGKMCDRVIEATGKQVALDIAGKIIAEKGRLVIAGYHQDGLRNINMQMWNWKGVDVINAHERDPLIYAKGMGEAIEAIQNGEIDFIPLLTHYFFPSEVNQAFNLLASRTDGFMKGIMIFN